MIGEILRSFHLVLQDARELLTGVDERQMTCQPVAGMNPPAWIVGHLIYSFQMMGGELGIAPWLTKEWSELFATGSRLQGDGGRYPGKGTLMEALADAERRLTVALASRTEAELNAVLPDERCRETLPTIGQAVLHILTVHAAIHVGQLSAWRRAMGLPRVRCNGEGA